MISSTSDSRQTPVVRIWTGVTTAPNAAAYEAHLRSDVIPELRRLDGFRGIRVLRRSVGADYEFRVLTVWDSLDAVRAFTGDNLDKAVVHKTARAILSSFDDHVIHYDLVEHLDLAP
jgi:heme-degrading monooxygenase HmoA